MVKLLIIADDFTGALDTGVQFAEKGIETQVFTGTELERDMISPTTQVLVVDSETRPMSREEAYQVVYRITRQALEMGVEVIYKKTDSALRGNVGSELAAVLDARGEGRLYFIPAFPDVNRTTLKGVHYIDGVRLEESSFGTDPFDPMTCSCIPEILAGQTDRRIIPVTVQEKIPCMQDTKEIVLFDAVTNEDIRTRAKELRDCRELKLLAGCAGFASFLPELLGLEGKYYGEIQKTEGFCVVCGSVNPITKEQITYAKQNGFFGKTLLPEEKLSEEFLETLSGREFLKEIIEQCRTWRRVIIDSFDVEGRENTMEYARRNQISPEMLRFSISKCLGKIVRYLLEQKLDLTILMTGGDTLMGFMKEIGVRQLNIVAEVGQGTVLSVLEWEKRRIQVISKSGGFGEKEVLCNIADLVLTDKRVKEDSEE